MYKACTVHFNLISYLDFASLPSINSLAHQVEFLGLVWNVVRTNEIGQLVCEIVCYYLFELACC